MTIAFSFIQNKEQKWKLKCYNSEKKNPIIQDIIFGQQIIKKEIVNIYIKVPGYIFGNYQNDILKIERKKNDLIEIIATDCLFNYSYLFSSTSKNINDILEFTRLNNNIDLF